MSVVLQLPLQYSDLRCGNAAKLTRHGHCQCSDQQQHSHNSWRLLHVTCWQQRSSVWSDGKGNQQLLQLLLLPHKYDVSCLTLKGRLCLRCQC
jgi:hypothetical protein